MSTKTEESRPATSAGRLPPRERIVTVASELFYERGVRAVGVDEIAAAADTNKMTLYRHFASKDALVTECLRQFAQRANARWDEIAAAHRHDPRGELRAWLADMAEHVAASDERGCALANAAVELPDKDHPARRVIEEFKIAQRERLARLCEAAGLMQPELAADELFLLLEGARVCAQCTGREGPAARLVRMGEAIIASLARDRRSG
ncbi:MAG: TetR/AcrR family transcriptional regulator [Xanthobacteraceae bacterium]